MFASAPVPTVSFKFFIRSFAIWRVIIYAAFSLFIVSVVLALDNQ